MIAEEWREALGALDEITGKKRLGEILNTIFGQFCIGK
jgi:tRNA U34 5-carboxymethylaminomethyl modifying GTPase MnmE/TrmE